MAATAGSPAATMPKILWQHPNPESTNIYKFKRMVEKKRNLKLFTYHDLYTYSITHRAAFWADCWEYFPIIHEGSYTTPVNESSRIDSSPSWFAGLSLNYAENVLFSPSPSSPSARTTHNKAPSAIAVVEIREGSSPRPITWSQLRRRVSLFASAMKAQGVVKGDRIGAIMQNSIDTLCVFLGATCLGALFSSSSTDMGTVGILDRLKQIRPRWVFFDDASIYGGKVVEMGAKIGEVVRGMEGVEGWDGVVSVPRLAESPIEARQRLVIGLEEFLRKGQECGDEEMMFERVGWGEGFLIVYSSGTTGPPKCIVHGVGGVVLGAWKEGSLHRELGPGSTALQFTTTGWIMYLASIQTLLFGAKLIMYDGNPFYPRVDSFLRLAGQQKVTHFGISPRYLATLQTAGVVPTKATDLSSLKVVTSTGMVLPPALFAYFYSDQGFPQHTHLANISGGTDLAGAFGDCTALLPVYETGGCQAKSLGLDVRVYDSTIESTEEKVVEGKEVPNGEPGELVCVKAFPNMPICFFGDNGNQKYHSAYFKRFENVWTHGDFIIEDPATRSIMFLGRADGVLNPSGIRFGSAEIYSIVDRYFGSVVEDSICVGQRREKDQDESVFLFCKMQNGQKLTTSLITDIKTAITQSLSRRHVPRYIFETPDIPTTINLKKVELPVKQILSGRFIKPSGTLANPDSLKYYEQFTDIERITGKGQSMSKL